MSTADASTASASFSASSSRVEANAVPEAGDGLNPTPSGPTKRKLTGWELYRDVMGSPRYIVAPMVDQSELVCRFVSLVLSSSPFRMGY